MNKTELVAEIVNRFEDHPIIFTTGFASRIAFALRPRASNHFYMVGSMGMASAVGRGIVAQLDSRSRYPVIVDGDGAMLMGIHCLLLEQETPGSILHIIANDGSYSSTGSQEVPSSSAAICGMASAAGYGLIRQLRTPELNLDESLSAARFTVLAGSSALLNCHVQAGPEPLGRIDLPLPDIARQFQTFAANQSPRG